MNTYGYIDVELMADRAEYEAKVMEEINEAEEREWQALLRELIED